MDPRDRTLNLAVQVAGQSPAIATAATPYLVLHGLTKRFGDTVAVEDLCLTVSKGEFVSLLGPSGCGKTTTLQMIAGFIEPTSGSASLAGRDLLQVPPRDRGLGIVFQSYALFPHMTVAANVAFGLEMRRLPRRECETRVREALVLVGLEAQAKRLPRQLSGGQQQRVALARALVIRPNLLLLDEPLSNLDAKLREEMRDELRSIQRHTGATTLLVTHDQAEAMALSDRVVVMNQGRAEQIATPQDAYARPANAFVAQFLGRTNLLHGLVCIDNSRARLQVGNASWLLPHAAGSGPVILTIRPERVAFGGTGLLGQVTACVFHGHEWLYRVVTDCGTLTVVSQNRGLPMPAEGDVVRLCWDVADMTLTPEAGAPAQGPPK